MGEDTPCTLVNSFDANLSKITYSSLLTHSLHQEECK